MNLKPTQYRAYIVTESFSSQNTDIEERRQLVEREWIQSIQYWTNGTCSCKIMLWFTITSKEASHHFFRECEKKILLEISSSRWHFVEVYHQRLNMVLNKKTAFKVAWEWCGIEEDHVNLDNNCLSLYCSLSLLSWPCWLKILNTSLVKEVRKSECHYARFIVLKIHAGFLLH